MRPSSLCPATDSADPASSGATASPGRLRHKILRAGGWAVGGFVLDKVVAVVQLSVVAHLLTPSDFGLMAASAAVVLAFVTVSDLGLESALVAKPRLEQEDLAVAWTVALARGSAMALCLWLSSDLIGRFMRMDQLSEVLRLHAWALVLQGLHSPGLAILTKQLEFRRRITLDLIRRLLEAGTTISLALWLRNVWALLVGQLIGFAVGALLSFWAAPFKPRLLWRRSILGYFLRCGAHRNVTGLCIFGVMSGGDLVIGRILGQDALGLYQVALAFPLFLGVRATALLHQVSVPTYALLRDDRAGIARVFGLQMGLATLVFVPSAIGVAVLAPVIVPIVFGPQWLGIVDPLRVLGLYVACAGLSSVTTALHYGLNRVDIQTKSWTVQFLSYAVAVVPLTAFAGLTGAAIALGLSYLVGLVVQWVGTRSLLGSPADGSLLFAGRALLPATGLAAGLALIVGGRTGDVATWLGPPVGAVILGCYGWYVWAVEVPRLKVLWTDR